MEVKEQEMLRLFVNVFLWTEGLVLLRALWFRRRFSTKGQCWPEWTGGLMEQQNYLKGNLVTRWSFSSFPPAYRRIQISVSYSAVQCTVLPARSYWGIDMYLLIVRRACGGFIFFSTSLTLFGLLRHNPLPWRFWCASALLVFGKATLSLRSKSQFGFTMTFVHKTRWGKVKIKHE